MKQTQVSRKSFLLLAALAFSFFCSGQYNVRGTVQNGKKEPVEGASIVIKDSYDGATSAKDGSFSFLIADTGYKILIISSMGYKTEEKEIFIPSTSVFNIFLKEEINELEAVVITAGVFEAGDKKRTTVFKSVDIVTTAGQQADLVAALKTLPGAQQVGEQEGLFVRGGTGTETKVFIDGIMVNNPFYSSVPGIAQRGRYSPLLFKGTVFSSGGYSAQYGQALSSVLILETIDLPSRSELNLIISSPQVSMIGQKLNKKKSGSTGLTINYSNLSPYFRVIPQKYDYSKAPETINAEFHSRQKVKGGMFRFYAYANHNELGFNKESLEYPGAKEFFYLRNKNLFTTAVFTGTLADSWQLYAGSSFNYNKDNIKRSTATKDSGYAYFIPQLKNTIIQSRVVLTKRFSGLTKLHMGAEYQKVHDEIIARDSIPLIRVNDNYLAFFTEADIYYSSRLVNRVGVRAEHSTLLGKTMLSPRISLAYKLDDKTQFSLAYGHFYQKPEVNYLFRKQDLDFTKAIHYILNFQRVTGGQTWRAELFYKKYKSLLTYPKNDPFNIKNNGSGYAKGFEIFWRDKHSIKNLDYWISYSFLDTKRQYLDYASQVQPSFAARHTASLVMKRFVSSLSTYFSATYSYASGRPYYNPNKGDIDFMKDRTIDFHTLGLQLNYLTLIRKANAVFILNVSNVIGNKQVFGYNFSNHKINGEYIHEALTPMAKRFVFAGLYLSIGADRRNTILD